jgi:mannose-6-phosphate isomerase-like protein (cupin superfamily)
MIFNTNSTPQIEELITAWQQFISKIDDWRELVEGVVPKQTFCGPVYEPTSPLSRPNESFAIADMRQVKVAEPHYHANGETEVYFVLSGTALTVVGGKELQIKAGDVIVTPPETAHFTIPKGDLVLVVINTPPFNPENNIYVAESNVDVKYDHEQFKSLLNN